MNSIRINFTETYGYIPTDNDILSLYRSGDLILTDSQENDLIKYFNL